MGAFTKLYQRKAERERKERERIAYEKKRAQDRIDSPSGKMSIAEKVLLFSLYGMSYHEFRKRT